MNMVPALSILDGRTTHSRRIPFEQSFSYKIFMIEVDIDRLPEADQVSSVFSVDRPNLFSFHQKDHGDRSGEHLRPWAEEVFAGAGVNISGCSVRRASFPRHLFYKFAPISLWTAFDSAGAPVGVIYEVNNTLGDSHSYVAEIGMGTSTHEADKSLYVSPFFDVSGRYCFKYHPTEHRLDLVVTTVEDGVVSHVANIASQRRLATTNAFLAASVRRPANTLGVTAGIHFEALKLWLKGAGYRSRPEAPKRSHTVAERPITEKHSVGDTI